MFPASESWRKSGAFVLATLLLGGIDQGLAAPPTTSGRPNPPAPQPPARLHFVANPRQQPRPQPQPRPVAPQPRPQPQPRPVAPQPRPQPLPRPVTPQPRPQPRPNVQPQPPAPQPKVVRPRRPQPVPSQPTTTPPPATVTTPAPNNTTINRNLYALPVLGALSPAYAYNPYAYGGYGYSGYGYPSYYYGYPGYGFGGPNILNTLFGLLPGQGGWGQAPGMSTGGRFYQYSNVTGSGVLNGSLPIVSQFGGIAGMPYPYGWNQTNSLPNASLVPPGVALNVAYNTLPGIPATQAPTSYGFGPVWGNGNPYLVNPFLLSAYNSPFYSPARANLVAAPVTAAPVSPLFKGLGNGGSGL